LGLVPGLVRSQSPCRSTTAAGCGGRAAGTPFVPLTGVSGPPAHTHQVRIVHFDGVIERGLQGLHQETGQQGVFLGLRQPAQMPDVFAPDGLRKLHQQRHAATHQPDLRYANGISVAVVIQERESRLAGPLADRLSSGTDWIAAPHPALPAVGRFRGGKRLQQPDEDRHARRTTCGSTARPRRAA